MGGAFCFQIWAQHALESVEGAAAHEHQDGANAISGDAKEREFWQAAELPCVDVVPPMILAHQTLSSPYRAPGYDGGQRRGAQGCQR